MNFKIIAIRPLANCNQQFLKNLKEFEFYTFYNDYNFKESLEENKIEFTYKKSIPDDFFYVKRANSNIDFPINISAIVGKNGAGKSTIVELMYVAFYNLAIKKEIIKKTEEKVAKINFTEQTDDLLKHIQQTIINYELEALDIIQTDELKKDIDNLGKLRNDLVKLSALIEPDPIEEILGVENINVQIMFTVYQKYYVLHSNSLGVNIYEFEDSKHNKYKMQISDESTDMYQLLIKGGLFYNLVINYSFHALNSRELGDWIENIFHKNDGYQTPVVLNPFREEGTINVNVENYLVRSRLLVNVLQDKSTFLEVTPYNKIHRLLITFDENKSKKLGNSENEIDISPNIDSSYLFDKIFDTFINEEIRSKENLDIKDHIFNNKLKKYIINKLVKITKQYKVYEKFRSIDIFSIDNFDYLERLKKDDSHVVLKLKQAIHFLYFNNVLGGKEDSVYQYFKNDLPQIKPYDKEVSILSVELNVRSKNYDIELIELLPPSFLYVDYIFENEGYFSKLSSGEKQNIYTMNSLLYHLNNINSVHRNTERDQPDDLIAYDFVNVVFDEIELYYHPEMQRKFIDELLNNLAKLDINYIKGINFIFITHSPFILSDIPSSNVMFLEVKKRRNELRPFAFQKINLNDNVLTFASNIHDLLSDGFFMNQGYMGEYAKKKINALIKTFESKKIKYVGEKVEDNKLLIDQIGEPLLRNTLLDLHRDKVMESNQ